MFEESENVMDNEHVVAGTVAADEVGTSKHTAVIAMVIKLGERHIDAAVMVLIDLI